MVASVDRRQAPEQTEEHYRVRKGLTIREEISTAFRVGQSHFDAFAKLQNPSVEATRRFARGFLAETFGFDDLASADGMISFLAGGRVPIVVVPPSDEKLDRRSPTLSIERSRSPALALQDYLNDSDATLWGLVTNGAVIRLMRDNASLTRPAYIEADLAAIFTNEDAASFAVLWSLIHRTRFGAAGASPTDCVLERWRDAGAREGEAARDRLASQVEVALKVLGSGFLEANPDLAAQLRSGEVNLTEWFNELLRLVYRLIFLMVAEDRNLLHPDTAKPEARKLYAEGYGLTHLRAQAARAASWDKHHDRFETIKIVFRALAHGQDKLGLPALGGLFNADRLPHLETARLRNRAFMQALYRLSWLSDKAGLIPVNWRAMKTEELGSVYETLLELQPQLGDDARTLKFASETAEQKGNQRKTTGSYYTPDSLVQALLDSALDPVLDRVEAGADPAAALLNLAVIDPACGSGHFLLSAAGRIATRLARIRAEGTPSIADFRHALRDVARNCIHGVDRNPMAVELTKVALWIETVDPGLPLGFFDAQIRCGDALLGVFDLKVLEQGIPDAAYKPLTGDDKEVAKHYTQKNKREKAEKDRIAKGFGFDRARDLMRDFEKLRAMPEDTVEQIEAKADRLHALTAQGASAWQLETTCDLYVAAFLLPKKKGGPHAGPDGMPRRGVETVPTSGTIWEWLRGVQPFGPLFETAVDAARKARAFHWPLEFPDVMQRGGFDAVLGNPPWERIKLLEQEFFAARSPEIAGAPNKAARDRLIKALAAAPEGSAERTLSDAFIGAKREAEATSEFVRVLGEEGGRFGLSGRGDVNTYALFGELFASLSRARAGIIAPTGIATDITTAPFFADLVSNKRLAQLVDFENRNAIFSDVHRSFKFCILTLGRNESEARFSFFLTDPAQLAETERKFTLSPGIIERLNPNTLTAPVFRSRADAGLTSQVYSRVPVLIDEGKGPDGNPWGISFARLFDMSNDSHLFRTAAQLAAEGFVRRGTDWVREGSRSPQPAVEGTGVGTAPLTEGSQREARHVPLYEAKLTWHFDHRASSYHARGEDRGNRVLPPTTEQDHADPRFEVEPFYWVERTEVEARLGDRAGQREFLLGWRDITTAIAERTMVPCVIPRVAVGNSFFVALPDCSAEKLVGLYANWASLAFDFIARQKIPYVHLTYSIVKQLPVFPPAFYTEPRLTFIVPKVLELTYTSYSMAPFARELGYEGPPFAWDKDRRAQLRADLDAFYARAYGLDRDELRYILDPADVKGPDYPSETFRVLKEKEIRQFGEYRTRRLMLEAWDQMEADGTFVGLGLGAGQIAGTAPTIQKPALATLPGSAWMRAAQQPNDAGAALTAILKAIDGPTPSRTVRLAAAMMLEPHLLTPLLPEARAREWRRLVGQESQPRTGNVVGFAARTNQGWGAAVSNHRGNGRLIENLSAGTWTPGLGLDAFDTAGWPDGRAGFVLEALAALDLNATVTSMPDEVRESYAGNWVTAAIRRRGLRGCR